MNDFCLLLIFNKLEIFKSKRREKYLRPRCVLRVECNVSLQLRQGSRALYRQGHFIDKQISLILTFYRQYFLSIGALYRQYFLSTGTLYRQYFLSIGTLYRQYFLSTGALYRQYFLSTLYLWKSTLNLLIKSTVDKKYCR